MVEWYLKYYPGKMYIIIDFFKKNNIRDGFGSHAGPRTTPAELVTESYTPGTGTDRLTRDSRGAALLLIKSHLWA